MVDRRIHEAARLGDAATVRELLDAGMDVNASDEDNATALHWAAAWGKEDVALLLLGAGADPSRTDHEGNTPLHLASKKGYTSPKLVNHLLQHSAVDVNARNAAGMTALHHAARRGRSDMVRLLLEAGADPSLRDDGGHVPLDLALQHRRDAVVDVLKGWVGA